MAISTPSSSGNTTQSKNVTPRTHPRNPEAKQRASTTGTSNAAQASQSTCSRSIPLERRSRSRIATAPATRLASMPTHSTQNSHSRCSSAQVPTALPAMGFGTSASSP